jgi:two-component system sensor histidine kinase BarA
MITIPEHLPVIDWELSLKLAGNRHDLAKDMLALIYKQLPADINQIKTAYHEQNTAQLIHHVHKLHGALCYCGLPRLKFLIAHLESDLKNHIMDSSLPLLGQLDIEVSLLAAAMVAEPHKLTSSSDKND